MKHDITTVVIELHVSVAVQCSEGVEEHPSCNELQVGYLHLVIDGKHVTVKSHCVTC